MAIKIYTDASSNLFESILKEKNLDIQVLPMTVEIGDKSYLCYKDQIDVVEFSKTFYEKMKEGIRPKTSLPNPGLFQQSMEKEISNGNKVLYISLAGGISGTFQTTSMIANQINAKYKEEKVKVLNSKTAGLGEGMICMYAYQESLEENNLEKLFEGRGVYKEDKKRIHRRFPNLSDKQRKDFQNHSESNFTTFHQASSLRFRRRKNRIDKLGTWES